MAGKTVLLVEDEDNLRETLSYRLGMDGYRVLTARDGGEGLASARERKPDLVVLDLMLPVLDGLEVCRILRKEADMPILILTARDEDVDKIVGLELGADDYVTKPFNMRELLARIKALLRRSEMRGSPADAEPREVLAADGLRLDVSAHRAWLYDRLLDLKPREFELLAFLMRHRGLAFTREQLLDRVWGYDAATDTRTVDVHVRWLREKIEAEPGQPKLLSTVRGVGYRFEA